MALQRLGIQQLVGVDRNSTEGATQAPQEVRNLAFDRQGGLVALGARKADFTADLSSAAVLAYDESSMALLSSPAVFTTSRLITLAAPAFAEQPLTLIPRGGVVTRFLRNASGTFDGRAFTRSPQGTFTEHAAAPAVTYTAGSAGSQVPAATYEFIWLLEAPTDAGLVTYAAGTGTHVVGSGLTDLEIELASAIPAGHVVRFYYRRSEAGYDRFAVKVSDGVNPVAAKLTSTSAFVATEDALVNYRAGRTEVHEGRVWGVAVEQPFLPFLPASAQERTDAVLVSPLSRAPTAAWASATTAAGDRPLTALNDRVAYRIRKLVATRVTTGAASAVPLWRMARNNVALVGRIAWGPARPSPIGAEAFGSPTLDLRWSNATTNATHLEMKVALPNIPGLGGAAGATVAVEGRRIEAEITTVTVGSGVTIGVTARVYDGNGVLLGTGSDVAASDSTAWWTDWTASNATTVNLLRLVDPPSGDPTTYGPFEAEVTRVWAGTSIADDFVLDAADYASGTSVVSSGDGGETWTLASSTFARVTFSPLEVGDALTISQPDLTVVFSDVGSANRGRQANSITFTPTASSRITALASTPAGLLVFMQNETWLVSGNPDPISGDVRVQRFSGTMGCDVGVIPARLGSVVFPIYRGEVYAINLGMGDVDFGSGIENVSRQVWRRDDPFVQVVGENQRNHLVARTAADRIYRYDAEVKQWVNDTFDGAAGGTGNASLLLEDGDRLLLEDGSALQLEDALVENRIVLLPACLCPTYGTRYLVNNSFQVVDFAAEPDQVFVEWRDLDVGDKQQAKLWRRVEVATDDAYVGPPTMRYRARGAPVTVTGVRSGRGRWSLSFQRGEVAAKVDLRVDLPGFGAGNVLEAPIVIEVAPRNRSRGRVA